jgi:hypothetical protein
MAIPIDKSGCRNGGMTMPSSDDRRDPSVDIGLASPEGCEIEAHWKIPEPKLTTPTAQRERWRLNSDSGDGRP